MELTLRWFGKDFDSVSLEQIRQIPGVTGVITTLYDTVPGEPWSLAAIEKLKDEVEASGLRIAGIESINVHDEIKAGTANRDALIDNYIISLENCGKMGIDLVCYNFMPVFDWTRSDLAKLREDGSTVLSYDQTIIDNFDVDTMLSSIEDQSQGFVLPGWEPDRMAKIKDLFAMYADIDEEKLFDNLVYFLERIMPTCEKYQIKMAIHADDPAWSVFGLPRIMINKDNLLRLTEAVPSVYNGITFCSGSLGSNPANDLPEIIRSLKGRIHFAHVRNIKHHSPGKFEEAAHLSSDGSLDMYEIMKALNDIEFAGPLRPDHGRAIWGEVSMPGYGLYDRALGATYLNGLWESIEKAKNSN